MKPAWTLRPREGVERSELKIVFGQSREALREHLQDAFSPPQSHFEDEDDFAHADGTLIRVRYDEAGVQDIEVLEGVLTYEGIRLCGDVTWPQVQSQLATLGITFRPTQWLGDGTDCLPIAVNIATHEQIGGDGDGVEWVILSKRFRD